MKRSWHFHLVKREHEACDNLLKRERGTCRDEACKSVCITAFFSDGLISSSDAIERAVFLLLVKRCMRLRTHTHTQFRDCLWSPLQSIQPRHIPSHSNTSTHTPKKLPTKLFSFIRGPILQKEEREQKKSRGEKRESCKEERDSSHIKMRPEEKLLLLGVSWIGVRRRRRGRRGVNDKVWRKKESRVHKNRFAFSK